MSRLADVIDEYRSLGIEQQIDYDRFYLYSIITHSTAIEGSTVTEIENRLLFDEGISANKPMVEQLMNLDLRKAYERGFEIADRREKFTVEGLCRLSGILMRNTGSVYNTALGSFSSADGDLRLVNVSAGGGKSYMAWQKVPGRLQDFVDWLNDGVAGLTASADAGPSSKISGAELEAAYRFSFLAHYRLVEIHPWADGNGRMARLVMNIIQREAGVPMSVVRKESRVDYIQSLYDSQTADDCSGFIDFMTKHHIQNICEQIREYRASAGDPGVVNETVREYTKRETVREYTVKLTAKEQAVLDQIRNDTDITIQRITDATGFSRPTVTRAIKALKEKGLINRIGASKNGCWGISEY